MTAFFQSRLIPAYFTQHKAQFDFKIHSVNLVTLAKQPGAKVKIYRLCLFQTVLI
jgi:hypothetical protein